MSLIELDFYLLACSKCVFLFLNSINTILLKIFFLHMPKINKLIIFYIISNNKLTFLIPNLLNDKLYSRSEYENS